jgi:hypothetical protein
MLHIRLPTSTVPLPKLQRRDILLFNGVEGNGTALGPVLNGEGTERRPLLGVDDGILDAFEF